MTMTREEAVRLIESARARRQVRRYGPRRRARPVYDDAGGGWPQAVAEALGVPVFLASYGPRAPDKRVLGVASCC